MRKGTTNSIKIFSLALTALLCNTAAKAQVHTGTNYPAGTTVNYVRSWSATAPEQDPNNLMARPVRDVKQATQYIDGLGRPIQTVIKQGSLVTGQAPTDMVSPVEYDAYGREVYKWLPYASATSDGNFKLNPFTEQGGFYNSTNTASPIYSQGETFFYSTTNYEASPLNRIQKTMPPGNSWSGSGRGVRKEYGINESFETVIRMWTIDYAPGSLPASPGVYAPGQLYRTATYDENNNLSFEYTDKEGHTVVKSLQNGTEWLFTFYVYDDLGNLRCVIPPKAVPLIWQNWVMTQSVMDELCFRYEYDQRNRMVTKKIPGAAPVSMVYDSRDRLVLTQDGNLAAQGKWLYTTYDDINRPVTTGLWTTAQTAAQLSATASSSSNYPLPDGTAAFEELNRTFYDYYDWLSVYGNPVTAAYNSSYDTYLQSPSNSTWPYPQANVQSALIKGMPTGSRVKILGTSNYLYTVNFYDDKGRVIQTQSTNLTGGTDVATTQYTWAGQPLVTVQAQQKAGSNAQTTVVVSQLTYDDLGRVTKTEKKVSNTLVNNNAMPAYKTITQNQYNALGQLKTKKLGTSPTTGNELENLTYDYNIRGWLLGTNRDYARDYNSSNYFGFDLGYDKANNNIINNQSYANPQYNGNIEGMVWKSKGDGEKRKYDFTYDGANRILSADFNQYNGSSFDKSAGVDFSMSGMSYDGNGNILTMNQMGLKINASSPIDQLHYTYQPNSNKLQQVTDDANDNTSKLGDFKYNPATKKATDYSYDVNGNLNLDNNKAISSITYNHLNLPQTITITGKGTITYTYDAAGNKIKKQTVDNSTAGKTITTTTTYLNGLVYESKTTSPADANNPDYTDVLQLIPQEEGRIRFKPAAGNIAASLQYDYMLKDHLGNVRMVLTEEQKTDQYPAATMETAQSTTEEALYGNLPATRTAKPAGYPVDNTTSPNNNVAKVNGSRNKIGPSIILKVMAGDKFNLKVSSWYTANGSTPVAPNTLITDLINSLSNTIATASGGKATAIQLQNSASFTSPIGFFVNQQELYSSATKPRAYITWIAFDEQFNYEYQSSGFEQVGDDQEFKVHVKNDLSITKNGYLYIYVSNETPNIDVFFDNLQVTHTRGPILEETHYYPFGLTMAGISSKSAGGLVNKIKFNSYEFNSDFDINLGESFFRSHDPQIGRFWQLDTKPNEAMSLYSAMNNNPVLYSDPLGDTSMYYNSKGEQIGVINRGSGVTAVEVGDGWNDIVGVFITAINANKDLNDKQVAGYDALLQSTGTAYNVSSFEKFYNDNQVDAKSFAGDNTKDMKNFKYDGKPMKLKAEVYGDVVLEKGVVTMGTGKTSTGSANMGFFDDIPRAKNSVADIHIHPIAETGRFSYDLKTGSGTISRSGSMIAGPSGADMGHAQFNQGTYRSVVVDAKNVYLYQGPGTPVIVIPRK